MVRIFIYGCVIILLWILQNPVFAINYQDDSLKSVTLIGIKAHKGAVLIHSRDLRAIRDSYPSGLEMDLAWHKISQRSWNSCLCYPRLGIALTFWNYDNPEVLGEGITGMFYLEPVFGAANQVSFSIRAAFGLSYQNRPHDPISNPDNLSYSTYLAFPLQLGGTLHLRAGPRVLVNGTLVYNHFSNGGIREPNVGINWPSAALGIEYYLKDINFNKRKKVDWRELGPPLERLDFTLLLAFEEPERTNFLFSPGIEIKWSRQFARINAYTLGGELIYDKGTRYFIEKNGMDSSPVKGSLAAGHEFLLKKFIFSQQFGVYIYKPFEIHSNVYQRYGLVYRINSRFMAGFNMKVHGHIANFVDFRATISI